MLTQVISHSWPSTLSFWRTTVSPCRALKGAGQAHGMGHPGGCAWPASEQPDHPGCLLRSVQAGLGSSCLLRTPSPRQNYTRSAEAERSGVRTAHYAPGWVGGWWAHPPRAGLAPPCLPAPAAKQAVQGGAGLVHEHKVQDRGEKGGHCVPQGACRNHHDSPAKHIARSLLRITTAPAATQPCPAMPCLPAPSRRAPARPAAAWAGSAPPGCAPCTAAAPRHPRPPQTGPGSGCRCRTCKRRATAADHACA